MKINVIFIVNIFQILVFCASELEPGSAAPLLSYFRVRNIKYLWKMHYSIYVRIYENGIHISLHGPGESSSGEVVTATSVSLPSSPRMFVAFVYVSVYPYSYVYAHQVLQNLRGVVFKETGCYLSPSQQRWAMCRPDYVSIFLNRLCVKFVFAIVLLPICRSSWGERGSISNSHLRKN